MIDLNGIRLRNRVLTSASLLGYGGGKSWPVLYGLSPFANWVDLQSFGAVVTRTLTREPREGHFTLRQHWPPRDWGLMFRLYGRALQPTDAGWLNAFGWSNIGIDAYLREYFPITHGINRIISLGGFSSDDLCELVDKVNEHVPVGSVAAVEFNVSCPNVNFHLASILEDVLRRAAPRSRHPVILKISPDFDYLLHARLAQVYGVAAICAINTVKALRLNPETGQPLLKNRYGGLSGRAIKPIGLRVVSELREAGIELPIIATGGIRTFDDCREYAWAGADAVSLGSEIWLAPYWMYLFGPIRGLQVRRLLHQVQRFQPRGGWRRWPPTSNTPEPVVAVPNSGPAKFAAGRPAAPGPSWSPGE
jgi:dihydroorotate dehydrogenase (NAD+) catalytic subunit